MEGDAANGKHIHAVSIHVVRPGVDELNVALHAVRVRISCVDVPALGRLPVATEWSMSASVMQQPLRASKAQHRIRTPHPLWSCSFICSAIA